MGNVRNPVLQNLVRQNLDYKILCDQNPVRQNLGKQNLGNQNPVYYYYYLLIDYKTFLQ